MTTTKKHRNFVTEPAGDKPVTQIAGVGPALGKRLADHGYGKAMNLVGEYLDKDGDPNKFMEFMKETANANEKESYNAFKCIKDYADRHIVDNNRGKRKNSQQMEILLKFMEDNPDIAKGSVRGDKEKWREVKIILNGAGPPTNDVNGWKKTWSDWKRSVRTKLSHNKEENRATGSGAFLKNTLNEQEKRLARISDLMSQSPIKVQDTIECKESVNSMMESHNKNIIKILDHLSKTEKNHSDNSRRIIKSLESLDANMREIKKLFKKHHEVIQKIMIEKNNFKKRMLEIEEEKFEISKNAH